MSHAEIEQSLPAAVPAKMNAHFVDCLLNDREPVVTAEQSLHIVKIVDACYRSLETGRREEVK